MRERELFPIFSCSHTCGIATLVFRNIYSIIQVIQRKIAGCDINFIEIVIE